MHRSRSCASYPNKGFLQYHDPISPGVQREQLRQLVHEAVDALQNDTYLEAALRILRDLAPGGGDLPPPASRLPC